MFSKTNRINREKTTVKAMIKLYCNDKHNTKDELCSECKELADYADIRLDKCKFGRGKPTCGNCPIHCYKPDLRQKVKEVMKYSGPRMTLKHPLLALGHLLDSFKKV